MRVEATIEDTQRGWDEQERQFPKKGEPGLSYRRECVTVAWVEHKPTGTTIPIPSERPVDCLLWRNNKGALIGVLYHYPEDIEDLEQAGNVNVFVHPRRQHRGIGSRLLVEAMRRWDIDPAQQAYTPSGAAMMNRVLADVETA